MREEAEPFKTLSECLAAVPYQEPPWSLRYPRLTTILADNPGAPKGNAIRHNINLNGTWTDIDKAVEPLIIFSENLVDQAPGFKDLAGRNFALRKDSPAFHLGFRKIAIRSVGLYRDRLRPSVSATKTPSLGSSAEP